VKRLPDPMQWLANGIPLALLIDLLDPLGPDSVRAYAEEPGEADWLVPVSNAA
jgi:hypothetical protein